MEEQQNNDDDNNPEPIKYDEIKEIVEDREQPAEQVEQPIEHTQTEADKPPETTPEIDDKEVKKPKKKPPSREKLQETTTCPDCNTTMTTKSYKYSHAKKM